MTIISLLAPWEGKLMQTMGASFTKGVIYRQMTMNDQGDVIRFKKLQRNSLQEARQWQNAKQRDPGNIIGSGRAEADGEMLNAAFIETSDYKTILEAHDATFVVGRRGTGKSALFIKAKEKFGSNPRIVLVTETPEEHESIELQRVLELHAPDYRLARALCRIAWKIDIMLGVIQRNTPFVESLQQLPESLQQLLKEHSQL